MEKDMKDVLRRLSEINSASEKIVKNTNHEKAAYADYIKEKTAKFDAEIQKKIADEVDGLKVEIAAENDAILEQSRKNLDSTLKALDKSYEANADTWIQSIFEGIIKE